MRKSLKICNGEKIQRKSVSVAYLALSPERCSRAYSRIITINRYSSFVGGHKRNSNSRKSPKRRGLNRMGSDHAMTAYCINLDKRPDKWKETESSFEGTGLALRRHSATLHREGWRGCGASHVALAREALRLGLPWVIVVEDDCLPSGDFAERWPVVRDALAAEKGQWDIFLGGPTYVQGPIDMRGPLIGIDTGFALHFYVLNASAYEKAIAWNADRHGPIDVYYSNQFRIVTTHPPLAVQRPSVSDIKGEYRNYTDHFDESDETFQKLFYAARNRQTTIIMLCISAGLVAYLLSRR